MFLTESLLRLYHVLILFRYHENSYKLTKWKEMNDMDKNEKLHIMIREARDLAKEHANEAEDPKCAALCETSYEVLAGLEKAFDHYADKSEKAWQ